MNRTDINKYLTNPELISEASREELRRLVESYPYCEALHWIYLRALYIADDAMFDEELLLHGMHISNRRLFYNYLTFEADTTDSAIATEIQTAIPLPVQTPDYFALEQNQAQKQSLQQLAEQLKKARLERQKQSTDNRLQMTDNKVQRVDDKEQRTDDKVQNVDTATKQSVTIPSQPVEQPQKTEEEAKKLIKEQKYLEAIEILRSISLNNPKKSANFALQIKFLETIINNHNKK